MAETVGWRRRRSRRGYSEWWIVGDGVSCGIWDWWETEGEGDDEDAGSRADERDRNRRRGRRGEDEDAGECEAGEGATETVERSGEG